MSDKIKIELKKETIKQSASMVDVMMANEVCMKITHLLF